MGKNQICRILQKETNGIFIILLLSNLSLFSQINQKVQWLTTINIPTNSSDKMELIIPFYEGLKIDNPERAFHEIGLTQFELLYPSPLSIPFVAWSIDKDIWTIVYATRLNVIPLQLFVGINTGSITLQFVSFSQCTFDSIFVKGDWKKLGQVLQKKWKVIPGFKPLKKYFNNIKFFTNKWISEDSIAPLKIDWEIKSLTENLKSKSPKSLIFIYGFDPAGIDFCGKYFWSNNSLTNAERIIKFNRNLKHLSWLNLRSYKFEIPILKLKNVPNKEQTQASRKYADGNNIYESYHFRALEMCLASKEWQESRLNEFNRLINCGFKVIQLDEFPIPTHWHAIPCQSQNHLHKPNDLVDEWNQIMMFIKKLHHQARKHNILLTSEEPSVVLLPYISGYIDRMYNDSPDIYGVWKKSKHIHLIPLFSTMFGSIITPYTDASPSQQPAKNWLKMVKIPSK